MRPSPRRWSSFRGAVVAAVVGVLVFAGAPMAAWSAPTPSPAPSGSVAAQDEDESETPAPSENATPAEEETPADVETPAEDESASDETSAEPSEDTEESAEPEESESAAADDEQSEAAAEDEIGVLAIPPLSCTGGEIYQIQRAAGGNTTGRLNGVVVGPMTGTSPVTATQVTTSLIPAGDPGPNALGITAGGQGAWALSPQTPGGTGDTLVFTLYSFDVTTEIWTPHTANINTAGRLPSGVTAASIRSGGIVAGAIDPLSGNYYWASLANAPVDSMTIFGWNTTTNLSIGVVANSTVPQDVPGGNAGTNGDIAFDAAGNLYVVSNTGTAAALGVIQGPLPTSQQPTTPTLVNTPLTTFENATNNSYNGIAFNSAGDLFIEYTSGNDTFILKRNPTTGAPIAGPSQVNFTSPGGGIGVDLAACSTPPTLQLRKNVVNRQANTDQFALAITGGGITGGNTATTSGTATGVQPQTAGPVVARVGNTYTFTETAAGTTTLANYTTTYECRNQGNTVVASGSGRTFNLTPAAGQAILCTFTNSAPRLVLDKTSTATQIVPGAQVPYTLTVRNTGSQPATNVVVTDTLPLGLTFVSSTSSCTAAGQLVTCNLATLAADATWTINMVTSAANPFPPTAVDPTGNVVNTARVTSPGTNCPSATSTDPDCTGEVPLPIRTTLTLVKVVNPGTSGAANVPADWALTAVGGGTPATTVTGPGNSPSVTNQTVRFGTYNLSETGPAGWTASAWVCTGGTSTTATSVTLAPGQSGTCTITNTAVAPRLTLVKAVNPGTSGATNPPADWTLTATRTVGTTVVTGPGNSAAVTNQAVPVGTYTLSETGPGAPGWTASSWVCTGGASTTATSVTLAPGSNATCTITNTAAQPRLTLVKAVNANGTGAINVPADWTLTATRTTGTPATVVTGPGNSPAVTNQAVPVGTYTLSETGPGAPGWTASNWVCTGGASTTATSVTLAPGSNATCTITNTAVQPRLTLVKAVNANGTGATQVPANWTLTATRTTGTPATVVTGPGNTPAVTNQAVPIGTYTLSETGPGAPGWTASAWVCTGGATTTGTSVTLAPGSNATCTITNTAVQPRLTLVKTVNANGTGATQVPASWNLTAINGPTTVTGPGNSPQVTNQAVPIGTYTLTETGPGTPGWTASNWVCTGGASTTATTVTLAPGSNATCTITNTAVTPRLTLVKTVNANGTGATQVQANWNLTAINGPTTVTGPGNSPQVTNQAVPIGTYTLTETGPGTPGWTASNWVCTGGASTTATTVTLAPGSNATCTITNTAVQPTLTLVKNVDPGDTGVDPIPTASTWNLTATGPTTVDGPGNSPDVTNQAVPIGDYVLSETGGPAGWTGGDWTCDGGQLDGSTVTIALADDVTCTITNTAVQPTLTLVKNVDQAGLDAGYAPADWELTAIGPESIVGPGNSAAVTEQPVPVGTYDLAETGPSGFDASAWVCTGAAASTATNVTLEVGSNATCTITNTAITPTLTLVKNVDNGETGADTPATAWTLTAENGDSTIEGATGTGPVTGATAIVGTYDLSEAGPAGYTASAWVCTGGTASTATSVTLAPGSNATCTITNTAVQPQLTLVKQVDNGETGADTPATAWTLTAENGDSTIEGATGTGPVTGATAIVGTYDLSEAGPAGYTASNWVCTGGTATTATSVTLAPGSNATCTITNTAVQPQLTLVKQVDNGETGADTPATAWTLTAENGDSTIEGATGTGPVTGATAIVGTYDLSEAGPAGYTASNWVCTGGTATTATSVTLGPGSNATCTITNTAVQPRLTLVKAVNANGTGATQVPANWNLTAVNGLTTVTGPGNSADVTNQAVPVGTYTLSETGPGTPGWTASTWVCTGGASTTATSVTLAPGSNATCTITNTAVQPRLTLVKAVNANNTGATQVPANWTLTAVRGGTPTTTITGPGNSADVTNQAVPVGTYDLSETGPGAPGWTASNWVCTGGASTTATSVTLAPGSNATCTITNTAVQPRLTLVKAVNANGTGATQVPANWTLTATRTTGTPATVVTGPGNTPAVTNQAVPIGTYTLSETGPGAPGWTASAWVCTGGATTTGTSVTLAPGSNATCTITNTAVIPRLTLVKSVNPGETGANTPATAWTLTAENGNSTIEGVTGTDPVTGAAAIVGTYNLSEDGPAGWTASAWVCSGGASTTATTVTLAPGSNATCTITNTAVPGTWDLRKSSDPAPNSTVQPGDRITYTVTATKTGGVNPIDRVVNDDLSDVLNNAMLVEGPTASTGTAAITGTELIWNIPSLGGTETVTYVVQVNEDAYGVTLRNAVTGEGSETCPPAEPGDDCSTTHYTPHYVLSKSSDPASEATVSPGDPITYTLTVTNDSRGVVSGAVVTDDLSDVLDNATFDEASITPNGQASLTGTTLTWNVPTISPDPDDPPVVTLTYTVIVNEGAYGVTLRNVVTPDDSGDCELPDDCTTSHPTPLWTLTKLSDPQAGTTVNPGDTVTYTLTARNVSDGVVTDGTATDDLSGVLDNATLDEDSITPADAATLSGTTLTWTLPNPFSPGDVATLTYTVTVNDGAYYEQLRNVATPGPAGECVAPDAMAMKVVAASLSGAVTAADEPEWCQTEHPTPGWTLEKSSDPSSGSEVSPGDQVTYTLTVTNDSNGVVSTAVVTDDLSDVLQYASLDAVPDGATLSGTTLTWNVPTVQPGYAAQLSYTVTVDDDAYDVAFANVATPGDGGVCTTCTTTHDTPPESSDPDDPEDSDENLPDTGGTSLVPLGLGAGFLIVGALLLNESRRRRLAAVKVRHHE